MAAAYGDVLMGMQSQTPRFPCSRIALSGRPAPRAPSQGHWDANLYVPSHSGSQRLVRSQAGVGEAPSILCWTQLRRFLLLGMETGPAPAPASSGGFLSHPVHDVVRSGADPGAVPTRCHPEDTGSAAWCQGRGLPSC